MYVKDITLQTVLDGLVDDMMALQEKGIQATVGSFRAIHFHSLGSSIYRSINNHHLGKRGEGSEMLSPVIGVSVLIQRLFFGYGIPSCMQGLLERTALHVQDDLCGHQGGLAISPGCV